MIKASKSACLIFARPVRNCFPSLPGAQSTPDDAVATAADEAIHRQGIYHLQLRQTLIAAQDAHQRKDLAHCGQALWPLL